MAFEIPVLDITLEASADLSADQFKFIVTDSNGQAALAGAGDAVTGVLQDDPDAVGQGGSIRVYGVTKVVSGAAITTGANVSSDAVAKAVTSTTGDFIFGIALEGASGADEVISILITQAGIAD